MRIVVGAALLRDGLVLAAQRTRPPAAAGRWELPGGGVEPGESDAAALARECREELDVAVAVGERLGPEVALDGDRALRVYVCALITEHEEPAAREHAALRWVPPGELDGLDWLPADRVLLDDVLGSWLAAGADPGDELRRRAPSSRPS